MKSKPAIFLVFDTQEMTHNKNAFPFYQSVDLDKQARIELKGTRAKSLKFKVFT